MVLKVGVRVGLECWGVGAPGYWIDEDGMLRVGVQRVELLGVGCGPVGVLRVGMLGWEFCRWEYCGSVC